MKKECRNKFICKFCVYTYNNLMKKRPFLRTPIANKISWKLCSSNEDINLAPRYAAVWHINLHVKGTMLTRYSFSGIKPLVTTFFCIWVCDNFAVNLQCFTNHMYSSEVNFSSDWTIHIINIIRRMTMSKTYTILYVFFFFFRITSPVSDLSCKRLDCRARISSSFDLASWKRASDLEAIICCKIISKLNQVFYQQWWATVCRFFYTNLDMIHGG